MKKVGAGVYNVLLLFVSLQCRRITGNLRKPRERIGRGRACFSCLGSEGSITVRLLPFFRPKGEKVLHIMLII